MSRSPILTIVVGLICAGCVYVVFSVAAGWADWVVFGMIVVTFLGAAAAIYPRSYPTRKRAYTRRSDDKFR
jgi:hypothetical protein